ncbi:hypothetical protein [Brevibacillus daliensis]|uniref:hypothetical protein n=1 Tax=Brevibacillus daliensis TaxID=2892995 RepID=UPI001E2AF47B|nr:hypothetical protein [Brevibacillus daliensis]
MDILYLLMALACSFLVYLLEKRCWIQLLRTSDEGEFHQWCKHLDEQNIHYWVKNRMIRDGESWVNIYKIMVPKEQASRVNTP